MLAHSQNDNVIPYSHSARLFHSLRNHSLVAAGSSSKNGKNGADLPISESRYQGWGIVRSFNTTTHLSGSDRASREVVWWEGLTGGHNKLGYTEGVMDLIRRVARL